MRLPNQRTVRQNLCTYLSDKPIRALSVKFGLRFGAIDQSEFRALSVKVSLRIWAIDQSERYPSKFVYVFGAIDQSER